MYIVNKPSNAILQLVYINYYGFRISLSFQLFSRAISIGYIVIKIPIKRDNISG